MVQAIYIGSILLGFKIANPRYTFFDVGFWFTRWFNRNALCANCMRIPREREVRQFSLLNILFRVEFRKKKKKNSGNWFLSRWSTFTLKSESIWIAEYRLHHWLCHTCFWALVRFYLWASFFFFERNGIFKHNFILFLCRNVHFVY